MAESKVYRARTIQEVQHILRASKNVIPVAGGTTFSIYSDEPYINIGSEILALNGVTQLKTLHKSDRYIDFGAAVTLDEIILRGRRNVPPVLYDALDRAGNVAIRGVATIGGNLAIKNPFTASFLPLLALDAQCELCTGKEVFWLPVSKYLTENPKTDNTKDRYSDQSILIKIRVKDEEWTHHVYKKIKNGQYMDEIPIFLFLVKVQKNVIVDVRLLFADKHLIRAKEFDNLLLGRTIPISKEDIGYILTEANEIFVNEQFSNSFNKKCFFNLIEKSLYKM